MKCSPKRSNYSTTLSTRETEKSTNSKRRDRSSIVPSIDDPHPKNLHLFASLLLFLIKHPVSCSPSRSSPIKKLERKSWSTWIWIITSERARRPKALSLSPVSIGISWVWSLDAVNCTPLARENVQSMRRCWVRTSWRYWISTSLPI